MRIAFFSETYPPYINGVATQTEMFKRTYEKLGHEVMVVTVGSEKQEDIVIKDNIVYLPGHEIKKIYNYRISPPVNPKKLTMVKDFNPDVIHVQNEFGVGISGMKFSEKYDIPLVYTLHSEYDRFLFYVGLNKFEKLSQKISDAYLKRIPKKADLIISPSAKAQNYVDRQKIYKKVHVIENTVDNELFKPSQEKEDFRKEFRKEYGLDDDTKAFVFVGRIGKEKNIEELVNSFIYSDLPKEKARLFIIGNGPDLDEIKQLIKDNNFEDRIACLGPKPNTEIPKYLYSMDYYTTASLSEMHSISMLEAMATGLPATIKLDPPNKSQIRVGKNGYQWQDKEEFKVLLEKILNFSPEEEQKLRDSTLEYIENNTNISQAEKMIDLYKEAIEIRKNK